MAAHRGFDCMTEWYLMPVNNNFFCILRFIFLRFRLSFYAVPVYLKYGVVIKK